MKIVDAKAEPRSVTLTIEVGDTDPESVRVATHIINAMMARSFLFFEDSEVIEEGTERWTFRKTLPISPS